MKISLLNDFDFTAAFKWTIQVQNEDNMEVDKKICSICLSEDVKDLISPCKCNGSMKFVHRNCLDQWRSSSKQDDAFTHCRICLFQFVLEDVTDTYEKERARYREYYCMMTLHGIAFALAIEAVALVLTLLTWLCDTRSSLLLHTLVSTEASPGATFAAYHFYGWAILFFCIGLCGLFLSVINEHGTGPTFCFCGDCKGDSRDGKIFLLIVVVVIILVGIFIGLYASYMWFKERSLALSQRIWKYQQTRLFVVKDFCGREPELLA